MIAAAALFLPAATLALRPTAASDAALIAKARSVAANTVGDVAIDAAQSFRVVRGKQFKGLLVSGSGEVARDGAGPVHGCFVAAVNADGRIKVIPTIGTDNWEAETCIGVKAVSLLKPDAAGTQRLVLIYDAASPNAAAVEPVVLRWSGRLNTAQIDVAASDKASQAGAETIAEVRTALGI
ncbi:MAG TPA: hypothetical protein PK808_03435 [Polymorphobacter sp.]|nr:hypothetical protein [Polymorphobacter sp.]